MKLLPYAEVKRTAILTLRGFCVKKKYNPSDDKRFSRPEPKGGGGGGRGGRKNEGSTADTAQKRPERPWTAARTMEVQVRRCPLAIAQRLVHCAIAVSTAVLGQSHKDNVRCTAVVATAMAKGVYSS